MRRRRCRARRAIRERADLTFLSEQLDHRVHELACAQNAWRKTTCLVVAAIAHSDHSARLHPSFGRSEDVKSIPPRTMIRPIRSLDSVSGVGAFQSLLDEREVPVGPSRFPVT